MDAETDMLSIDSTAEAEIFPKRNGWLRYACSKFDPAPNKPTKLAFIEKPVKTIPSEMVGYMFTRAYVWAEPKEWLPSQLELPLPKGLNDTHPTCVILSKVCLTPGNVPLRSIIVNSAKAATSRDAWISFSGSPWEEFPMPKRS